MRLPQPLVESRCFSFATVDEFLLAYGTDEFEATLITWLDDHGLPPITSNEALATMLGVNAGIIWSFVNRPHKYYRRFTIPKGKDDRVIYAPKVGLKIIQTWLSYHLARAYLCPDHVFGFVPGRSHIMAAIEHSGANWAYSVDIADFFQSTPALLVEEAFRFLGYEQPAAELLTRLCCVNGALAQGAPSSPPLSNICFRSTDQALGELARQFDIRVTRYADDIVFSGAAERPAGFQEAVQGLFAGTPWTINQAKTRLEPIKGRIKVHGLLVRERQIRLTKGYRNRVRAYRHILKTRDDPANARVLRGHVEYAKHVAELAIQGGACHPSDAARLTLPIAKREEPDVSDDGGSSVRTERQSVWGAFRNLFR